MLPHPTWLVYLAGQVLHVLMRANLSASSKLTGVKSVPDFLKTNWVALLVRVFLASLLFSWWRSDAGFLTHLLSRFNVEVGVALPVNAATAGIYGYFSDSVLDWLLSKIPALQKEVPPLNGQKEVPPLNGAKE